MPNSNSKYLFDAIDFGTGLTRKQEEVAEAREAAARNKAKAEAEAPPPPVYDQADLDAARIAGIAEGREQALMELNSMEARRAAELLEQVSKQATALMTGQDSANERRDRAALSAVIKMGRKLFPALSAAGSLDEIERMMAERLPDLLDETRLVIRVSEHELDLIRPRLENLADQQGFNGRLIFIGDTELGPGDCRLEWADGGAEREAHDMWAEFEQIATRLLGHSIPQGQGDQMAAQNAPDEVLIKDQGGENRHG